MNWMPKVAELGLSEFSLAKLKGQKEKLRGQIAQIRAEENDSLRSQMGICSKPWGKSSNL